MQIYSKSGYHATPKLNFLNIFLPIQLRSLYFVKVFSRFVRMLIKPIPLPKKKPTMNAAVRLPGKCSLLWIKMQKQFVLQPEKAKKNEFNFYGLIALLFKTTAQN